MSEFVCTFIIIYLKHIFCMFNILTFHWEFGVVLGLLVHIYPQIIFIFIQVRLYEYIQILRYFYYFFCKMSNFLLWQFRNLLSQIIPNLY